MVLVHAGPTGAPGVGGALAGLPHGRASVLFVLLAGVGIALLVGDASPQRVRTARLRLGWRALLLLPLGLALQPLDHGVLVILQHFAVYFLAGAAVVRAPDAVVLTGAALVALAGPVVALSVRRALPDWFAHPPAVLGDPPAQVAQDLLVSGAYPLVVWAAPLLLGVWIGRRDLRAASVARRLALLGAATAVSAWALGRLLAAVSPGVVDERAWWALADASPHSGMPLWIIGGMGSAAAVLGVALRVGARWPRGVWPLVAYGQLALTVYVAHLLVLAWWPELLARRDDVAAAALSVLRFTAVGALLATVWRALLGRGPLEALLRLPRWGRR